MLVCRPRNVRTMGIKYLFLRTLYLAVLAGYIFFGLKLFDIITAYDPDPALTTALMLPYMGILAVSVVALYFFFRRNIKSRYQAFLIADDKIYTADIVDICFENIKNNRLILLSTVITLLDLSGISPMPFKITVISFIISLLFTIAVHIKCAAEMYNAITDEYADKVIDFSAAEYIVKKVIYVKEYRGNTKIRLKLNKLHPKIINDRYTVIMTFRINQDYINSNELITKIIRMNMEE